MALRIKDNVDLKVLEKYGFNTRASSVVQGLSNIDFSDHYVDDNFGKIINENIEIDDETREIYVDVYLATKINFDILYDLIKDGLVEKVEG